MRKERLCANQWMSSSDDSTVDQYERGLLATEVGVVGGASARA